MSLREQLDEVENLFFFVGTQQNEVENLEELMS